MDEMLLKVLPPEAVVALHAFAAVVTAASVFVAALRAIVPKLKAWALTTQTEADDQIVADLGMLLEFVADSLDWLRRMLEPLALNRSSGKGGRS